MPFVEPGKIPAIKGPSPSFKGSGSSLKRSSSPFGRAVFDLGLFDFEGRRNRLSYFVAGIVNVTAATTLLVIAGVLGESGFSEELFLSPEGLVVLAASVWITSSITAQRLRDFGVSPWWTFAVVIASLVPLVNVAVTIFLWVKPGDNGHNEYGPSPLAELKRHSDPHVHDSTRVTDEDLRSAKTDVHSDPDDDKPRSSDAVQKEIKVKARSADAPHVSDEMFYFSANEELEGGSLNEALWIKCLTLEDGDSQKAKFRYIKARVEQLKRNSYKEI